jgi:asparagine synthase (glutamine-hydrolysing)
LYPNSKVSAFCIGLEGNSEDESKYARLVADKYNIDLHILNFSDNPLAEIDKWLYYNDDLLSDPSAFALYYLSKEISKRGFKVVLSGEGADELFGGYKSYLDTRKLKKGPFNHILSMIFNLLFKLSSRRLFENLSVRFSNISIYWGAANLYNELSLKKLLNNKKGYRWLKSSFSKFYKSGSDDLLNQKLYFDIHYRLPNDLLMRTDRATMASSLEARVPFLDNYLVDFAMSLPQESKFGEKLNKNKIILKRVASKYFDESFVYREKQGFPIPVSDWLRDQSIYIEMEQFVKEEKVQYLNYNYIKYMLNQHIEKKQEFGDRLFPLYLLEKYIRFWNID